MDQFLRLLHDVPFLVGLIGLLIGGAITLWIATKYGPIQNAALQKVIDAKQQQIDAQIELAKTTAAQYEMALNMQREHWSEELTKIETSRDQYKDQLHTCRNALGTENTELKLKVQELELRPSLELVQTEQKSFYRELLTEVHNLSSPERMLKFQKPILDACKEISDGMSHFADTMHDLLPKKKKV